MKRILFLLLLMAGFVACEDKDEDGKFDDITLEEGVAQNMTFFADERADTVSGAVRFTAKGAWKASVLPATKAEDTGWVTVFPDHGDVAGDYTVQIKLEVNTTGADRKAVISISCGSTVITITVEQKGTTESGEVPDDGGSELEPSVWSELVNRIEYHYLPWEPWGDRDQLEAVYEFEYDAENRISDYKMQELNEGKVVRTINGHLDYSRQGMIGMTETGFQGGSYDIELNNAGFMTSLSDKIQTFGYNDEGRIARMSWGENYWVKYYYTGGVLSAGEFNTEDGYEKVELGDNISFTDKPNDYLSIDVNMLFMKGMLSDDDGEDYEPDTVIMARFDRLAFLRLAGKGSARYIASGGEGDEWSNVKEEVLGGRVPGQIIEKVDTVYSPLWLEEDSQLNYVMEGNRIHSISHYTTIVKEEVRTYWEVTDDIKGEDGNGKIYRVEELFDREKRKELERGQSEYVYRFTYK